MDAKEIVIQIRSLPPHEKQMIAKMMSPFAWASEAVMKLAWLFHMLSPEEQIAFIEIIKCGKWEDLDCEEQQEEQSEETLVI